MPEWRMRARYRCRFRVTAAGRSRSGAVYYPRQSFFGALEGSVLQYDRPFDPIDGDYDIDRE